MHSYLGENPMILIRNRKYAAPQLTRLFCFKSHLLLTGKLHGIQLSQKHKSRYRCKDTQRVAFLEQRKEARMGPVKELSPTVTIVKMGTNPIKNIYVISIYTKSIKPQ